LFRREDVEQRAAATGQRVERHLPLTAIVGKTGRTQRTDVVGDEVLGPLNDPGEIADSELATLAQRERDDESCRIAERAITRGERTCFLFGRPRFPEYFRPR
jgi:hypothetical protein